jgi:hypothetical protein
VKPTVGRIVHFYDVASRVPWAAIVIAIRSSEVDVANQAVDLQVFSPVSGGVHIERSVPFAEKFKEKEKTWQWPPKEEDHKVGHAAHPGEVNNYKGKK